MLKKFLPFIVCPTLGLLVGWISIGIGASESSAEPAVLTRDARVSVSMPTRDEDLLRTARRAVKAEAATIGADLSEHLAAWTDEEVLKALEEAAKEPDALRLHDSMAALLLREYTTRDADRALAWVMTQPAILRQKLATVVISSWPSSRVSEALEFVRTNRDIFGRSFPLHLLEASLRESSSRGPGHVLATIGDLKELGEQPFIERPIQFSPGFDFAGLLGADELRSIEMKEMRRSILQSWVSQDREAAFRWLLVNDGPGSLLELLPMSHPASTESSRWMVWKLDELNPDQRKAFFGENATKLVRSMPDVAVWIDAARVPEVREALRSVAVQAIFMGADSFMERGLRALETVPDGETRLRILETVEPATDQGPLNSGAEKILRTKLIEWGADSTRTESIVERVREKSKFQAP